MTKKFVILSLIILFLTALVSCQSATPNKVPPIKPPVPKGDVFSLNGSYDLTIEIVSSSGPAVAMLKPSELDWEFLSANNELTFVAEYPKALELLQTFNRKATIADNKVSFELERKFQTLQVIQKIEIKLTSNTSFAYEATLETKGAENPSSLSFKGKGLLQKHIELKEGVYTLALQEKLGSKTLDVETESFNVSSTDTFISFTFQNDSITFRTSRTNNILRFTTKIGDDTDDDQFIGHFTLRLNNSESFDLLLTGTDLQDKPIEGLVVGPATLKK